MCLCVCLCVCVRSSMQAHIHMIFLQGTSLVVQGLRLHASNAGLIPGWETKIPHAMWCGLPAPKKDISALLLIRITRAVKEGSMTVLFNITLPSHPGPVSTLVSGSY